MSGMRTTIVRLAVATITALSATSGASGPQRASDAREIRELSDKWQRDVASQNVDAIAALHAPDAVVMMSHAPLMNGSTAIRSGWSQMVKTPGLSLHWTPTKIDVASPTVATEYGTYTESYDTPQGRASDAGNYVTIWHKINGKWRVALDAPVTSTPLPAAPAPSSEMLVRESTSLAWGDLNLPGVPPGIKIAVISGDPGKTGPFVLRLQFPDGYQIPLHWHPSPENVTILSGQMDFGMGNVVDMTRVHAYGPGTYASIPPRQAHYGVVHGVTIVQVHGDGPFVINVGAPK